MKNINTENETQNGSQTISQSDFTYGMESIAKINNALELLLTISLKKQVIEVLNDDVIALYEFKGILNDYLTQYLINPVNENIPSLTIKNNGGEA